MFDVESVAWLLLLGSCAVKTEASGAKTKGGLKNRTLGSLGLQWSCGPKRQCSNC